MKAYVHNAVSRILQQKSLFFRCWAKKSRVISVESYCHRFNRAILREGKSVSEIPTYQELRRDG